MAAPPVYRAVSERQGDPSVAVVIPPRPTAVPSTAAGTAPSQRDQHIRVMETAMFCYKAIIGRSLRARTLPAQKIETRDTCSVLNQMTKLGMPTSQRVR